MTTNTRLSVEEQFTVFGLSGALAVAILQCLVINDFVTTNEARTKPANT
jgi:hypothetical protein